MCLQDLSKNFVWILPFVQRHPTQCPSVFYITDSFLRLDLKLGGRLLHGESKTAAAATEGANLKRCIGALRYLYRNGLLSRLVIRHLVLQVFESIRYM